MQLIWLLMTAITVGLLAPKPVDAAPSLSDCRALAKVCIQPNQTRRINGFRVHAACWKWEDTYDCARPAPIRTDCTNLKASRDCSKTSQTCISRIEGVCLRYRVRWHCTAKQTNPGRATLTTERYQIRSDRNVSACTASAARADCRQVSQRCISGAESGDATRNIKGLDVTRDCWKWERIYECLGSGWEDDCGPVKQDANCTLTATDCLSNAPDGSCVHNEQIYSCGADSTGGGITQNCTSAAWCVDGDCTTAPSQPPNQSFGRAVSSMNLLQEMGKDFAFDGSNLSIFRGEKLSCSKWLLGLKNCCKVGGLLLRTKLAECSKNERKLSAKRAEKHTWHARSYCKNKAFFGLCTVKGEDHCVFKSRLGRMLQEQARGQLGIGRSNCRGLSVAEIERIDWAQVDLSEILGDITAKLQPVEEGQMKTQMKNRIDAFYRNAQSAGQNPKPEDK